MAVVFKIIGFYLAIPIYIYWIFKYGRSGAWKHMVEVANEVRAVGRFNVL